jgi:hypothetical protein
MNKSQAMKNLNQQMQVDSFLAFFEANFVFGSDSLNSSLFLLARRQAKEKIN